MEGTKKFESVLVKYKFCILITGNTKQQNESGQKSEVGSLGLVLCAAGLIQCKLQALVDEHMPSIKGTCLLHLAHCAASDFCQ